MSTVVKSLIIFTKVIIIVIWLWPTPSQLCPILQFFHMYVYIVYTLLVAIVGMIICRCIFAWPGVACYSVLELYVCTINASTCSHYDFKSVWLLYSLRHAVICSFCVIHTWFCVDCVNLTFCMLLFSLVLYLKIHGDSQIIHRSII